MQRLHRSNQRCSPRGHDATTWFGSLISVSEESFHELPSVSKGSAGALGRSLTPDV
jgi:hypothetical protein